MSDWAAGDGITVASCTGRGLHENLVTTGSKGSQLPRQELLYACPRLGILPPGSSGTAASARRHVHGS